MKKSKKEITVDLLTRGRWVNAAELNNKTGWRFGARLFELREDGYVMVKRRGVNGLDDWKIIAKPVKELV